VNKVSNRYNDNKTVHSDNRTRNSNHTKKPRPNKPEKQVGNKLDITKIEEMIMHLEEKSKEIENKFGLDTPPEIYVEYDGVIREIENLYKLYEECNSSG
jgi:hypothetical protein